MIDGIRSGSSLAQAALEAALRSESEAAARVQSAVERSLGAAARLAPPDTSAPAGFEQALTGSLRAVDQQVAATERLPLELVAGGMSDFHEVAAQLKRSELTLKFALEVRNKLIEAYRETMRMTV